jgi:hypothetical protein
MTCVAYLFHPFFFGDSEVSTSGVVGFLIPFFCVCYLLCLFKEICVLWVEGDQLVLGLGAVLSGHSSLGSLVTLLPLGRGQIPLHPQP